MMKANSIADIFSEDNKQLVGSVRSIQTQLQEGEISYIEYDDKLKELAETLRATMPGAVDVFLEVFSRIPPKVEDGVKETITQINSLVDNFNTLEKVIEKINGGELLSRDEILDLVEKFPEMMDDLQVDGDNVFLPVEALEKQQDKLNDILKKDIQNRQAYYQNALKNLDEGQEDYAEKRKEFTDQLNRLNDLENIDWTKSSPNPDFIKNLDNALEGYRDATNELSKAEYAEKAKAALKGIEGQVADGTLLWEQYEEAVKRLQETLKEPTTIGNLSSLESDLKTLSSALKEFEDNGELSSSTLQGLEEKFGDTKEFENFLAVAANSKTTTGELKTALGIVTK